MTRTVAERFWQKVAVSGPDECWLWTASERGNGYGQFKRHKGDKEGLAHRVSYELHYGEIPEGLLVRHKCDVRLCVNPSHLEIGTQKDNLRDMVLRGRSLKGDRNHSRLHPELIARGETHGNTFLSNVEIRFIKLWLRRGYTQTSIARAFNLSTSGMQHIKQGHTWGHIS